MVKTERPSYLTMVSYGLFKKVTPRFTAFKEIYLKSGIYRMYESYMALMIFVFSVTFISAFTANALLHHLLFNLTSLQYVIAVFTLSGSISLTVPIIFIIYPIYRQDQKRREIDANLVYTTGYMGVLSSGGISIERVFERVTQVERQSAIKDLTKRLIANIKVFGFDVASSLEDTRLRSPSEAFSKLLIGISNTVKTSGDLKSLLTYETKRLFHAKREQLKKTLSTLMIFGEIYITAMVMGPIVFIVMLTILTIMGNIALSISPVEQLNLLVFFGLPTMSAIFIIILNGILQEEE